MGEAGNSRSRKADYTVAAGRLAGIFSEWSLCNDQVDKFSGSCYAGFDTIGECEQFLKAKKSIFNDPGAIMVYEKSMVMTLTQHVQQLENDSENDETNNFSLGNITKWRDNECAKKLMDNLNRDEGHCRHSEYVEYEGAY